MPPTNMHLRCLWLGALITYSFLDLSQISATDIDSSLVCRICNGFQICGWKQFQTPECVNGIPCTVEQYRLCGKMADIIENQKCDHPGIFPDPKCPGKYYTCYNSKNTSGFIKRTWTCPARKTFDPVTKRCLSTDEKRMLQVVQTYDRLNKTVDNTKFVCQDVGIFPDPQDCKMYHICNTKLESQDFYCSEGAYFDGVKCNKAKQCLSRLEKKCQNQLNQGEEIYTRVRKLLATNRSTELENSFQDTARTKFDDESVEQSLRSTWNLQKKIRDKIRDIQKISERSFWDLQKLSDSITTITEKMTKRGKILKEIMNEKICSKVKKLVDEGSLKMKLYLCNVIHNSGVHCNCHQDNNGTNRNWANLSTHYTTLIPVNSHYDFDDNKTKYGKNTFVKHETTTAKPYNNTKTPDITDWLGSQEDNFTRDVYNEVNGGQTIPLKQTTAAEFYTEHSTLNDETEAGKTSNYRISEISTIGNYTDTTSHVDVYTNTKDESDVRQDLETTIPSKNKTAITEIGTTIQVYVTTDMEYMDIQTLQYENTSTSTKNDTYTTKHSAETPNQTVVNEGDETHSGQTASSEQSVTTAESNTEYPTLTEKTHSGNTTSGEYTSTTLESYSENTFYDDVYSTAKNEEKSSANHESKTTETPSDTTLDNTDDEYDDNMNNQANTPDEYDTDDNFDTDIQYDYTDIYVTSAQDDESTTHLGVQTSDKGNNTLEEITATQREDKPAIEIPKSEHSPYWLHIQKTQTTPVPKLTMSDIDGKTTDGGNTSENGDATFPTSTKTIFQRLNTETNTPKDFTTNRPYQTTANDSTSAFGVSEKDVIAKTVATEITLSTSQTVTATAKPPRPFRCFRAGHFEDPKDCHSYFRCSAVFTNTKRCRNCKSEGRWMLVDTHHTCKNGRWFSKVYCKCVKFRPLLC